MLFDEVVAEVIGRVPGRVDGDQRRVLAVHSLAGAQILDRLRQIRVAMPHLRHAESLEARAQRRDTAEVIAMAVRQDHARGLGPATLGEIALQQRHVVGHAGAGVDEDRITAADEIRVRSGPRHHAGIEAENAPDEVGGRRGRRKGRGHQFAWGAPTWPPTPPNAPNAPGDPWRSSLTRAAISARSY